MRGYEASEAGDRTDQRVADQQRQSIEGRLRAAKDGNSPTERQATTPQDVSTAVVEHFHDSAGRDMTVRRTAAWDGNTQDGFRHYELQHQGQRVGHVSMTMERSKEYQLTGQGSPDEYERVKINDIIIDPPYRGAGSARHLLAQVEHEASQHHAKEIYGAVTEREAAAFWKRLAKDGWQLEQRAGYGTVVSKQC